MATATGPASRPAVMAARCGEAYAHGRVATRVVVEGSRLSSPVSIVVPTYHEAANIPTLADRIDAALAGQGVKWELLLVDDDSGDGSEAIVAELARRLPVRIEVRRDPPRDLSLSVLAGIRLARWDRLVVMDADLSHPPERIPDLLAALDGGCDIVVGSRYAPGGRFDRTWSLWRFPQFAAGDTAGAGRW